ncbi:MAG: Asp-tRNA(Asn)/Glu-tRNA(Gln) amidotransferase subunit GatB [Candidatus Pacebacteria bacterium]|nr:Asp-tRNA(Asn)/Glu-tRNA(Gln) amidotransferase subunit GatB [Candidatus Paceibacterota bacterium]MBP9715599.1 Asp-tRNA(Asn)/Glu-tRNA(Gln) amidotransferase subunit GatB [Candidatus Paceibacterota bacterium]
MEKKYYTTIGLEIHAELNTVSKMFCGCKNDPEENHPNYNVCPVCMAHPGTLPVCNKKAIESVVRVGMAIDGEVSDFTEFDRKNYFYPDIPKAYQISQYKYPIVKGGKLAGVDITRVHLEEDTATSSHSADGSLVDFNRAGVPLMELVTEPVIHDIEQIGNFAKELQMLLRYLGVSDANMEKGQMRVEVNISVSTDPDKFGIPVEVKNIASFKSAERAAIYEQKRMIDLIEEDKIDEIVKETRGWDDAKQKTFSQRRKETADDYRYFPDPDIPKFYLSKMFNMEELRADLPELPSAKRARYQKDYGIKDEDIESYVGDIKLAEWFEGVAAKLNGPEQIKTASNYITSDYLGLKKSNPEINLPNNEHFAELIRMTTDGLISSRAAKDILAMIVIADESPMKIATEKDLIQKNDEGALKEIAQKIIDANPAVVATYKGGKENALMSLVGQIMKETKGSANPALVQKILKELLA